MIVLFSVLNSTVALFEPAFKNSVVQRPFVAILIIAENARIARH